MRTWRHSGIGRRLTLLAVALRLLSPAALSAAEPGAGSEAAELLEFSGTVEWSPEGGAWTAAHTGLRLAVGTHLRTGRSSRATLRLSDLSLVRLRENSLVELRSPTGSGARRNLFLRSGAAYFLNRERPMDIEFGTPLAHGAIRGTEFLLESDGASGPTRVALLDGAVTLDTAAGVLTLDPGQQVTVPLSGAPVRTPALPIQRLIQWVFYYPAVLVSGELEWGAGERERFAGSLAAYEAGDLAGARRDLPEPRPDDSAAARTYRAALDLSVGRVREAGEALDALDSAVPGVGALRELVDAVTSTLPEGPSATAPVLASDWLARSYGEQVRFELRTARDAARVATVLAPESGFAWHRLAELE
ncbi:MAG: FecR domain-containing protein, partial [Verrucomicrobia bacterium]|nr:FecR domain-containing protein [Verrucomicrobiota bacterium]